MSSTTPIYTNKFSITILGILSGLCWYLGNGLVGDFWFLVWVAPVPVLLIAYTNSGSMAFTASFIAYLIGRMSWFSYLVRVATLVPAIIFTLILPLVFALIIIAARQVVKKTNAWYSVFAFPALFTAFEYLVFKFSADGTAASVAYSQANCLPLVQVVSITGILGITFFVTLVPSAIALAWYFRQEKSKSKWVMISTGIPIIAILLFGFLRLNSNSPTNTIKAGIAVLDEKAHNTSDRPNPEKDSRTTAGYLQQVSKLAVQGAQVVLFPERALSLDKLSGDSIIKALSAVAKQNHVYIITGYTNLRGEKERNSSLVIDANGNIVLDYDKRHLVTGFESQFTPGNQIGLFKFAGTQMGSAVCKDMDFDSYIRQYGAEKPSILYVPAWDFIVDDWLHCRMAILRGVENGFSEVRAARLGRLTISDQYGKVTTEASCSNSQSASVVGDVSLQHTDTLYVRFGDWFGVLNLLAALGFILIGIVKRK